MRVLFYGIAALLAVAVTGVAAQPIKIGYIDVARVEKESVLSQQMMEELKKEFAGRDQQLQTLQKQGLDLQAQLQKEAVWLERH